jgi:branched-chain amino acid transport system ATP-binding protein
MAEPILETRGLSRSFGALLAVNAVSIAVARGSVHALIGPNGAGKSTLINLLSGELEPSDGAVRFGGRDITGLSADRIARLGVGRSFQRTNIYPSFTCFENCWIAAQSRLPSSLRFFRPAGRLGDVRARAERALDTCGLGARRGQVAGRMSYGEQRQLELGMLLATEPELLLLDEPLAGMGQEESAAVTALLRTLSGERTLLLVEHDMDAVFAIADRVTVMVNGAVLETGTCDEVRASRAVQEAYLGFEDAEPLP